MRSLLLGLLVLALADVAAAQDTSLLACPVFTKTAAGATVRVTKCKFTVKAPASPSVDRMCFRRVDTNADVICSPINPNQEIEVVTSPATLGAGHVIFAAFAIDSDSPVGVLVSGPSERRGILIDLDIPTLVKAVIETLPSVDTGPRKTLTLKVVD